MTEALPDAARENRVLRALPDEEFDRVIAQLTLERMDHGTVLFDIDERIRNVYFPLTGACSIVAETADAESCDVAVVGKEGFVGLPVFLGTEHMPMKAIAQVPGQALRMDADAFTAELERSPVLVQMLRRYTQMRMVEMAQTILCNRMHPLEQRTARWLLQLDERAGETPFELTQEFFATMLGAHRPSVTIAAGMLRESGLIDYSRGVIEILDREGLERVSCDCYRIIRDELDRLLVREQR